MQGIDKITERISADARREADELLESARRQAEAIRAEARSRAGTEGAQAQARARQMADERYERLQSVAALETRKMTLASKQASLDVVFDKALARLRQLPDAKMVPFLASLACRASRNGQEQIVLSPEDHARVGRQVTDEANAALRKAGRPASLTLSDKSRPLSGGLVLSDGDVEINCTFATIVRLKRETMAAEVADILFGV